VGTDTLTKTAWSRRGPSSRRIPAPGGRRPPWKEPAIGTGQVVRGSRQSQGRLTRQGRP
jgi:hypothetical protein